MIDIIIKILLLAAIILFVDYVFDLKKIIETISNHLLKYLKKEKPKSLQQLKSKTFKKERKDIISSNMNFVKAETTEDKYKKIRINSFIWASVLTIFCVAIKNYFLLPVLAVGGYLMPLWIYKWHHNKRKTILLNEIETTLSLVTATYFRKAEIVSAVKDNLEFIREPLLSHFALFVKEVETGYNIEKSLEKLARAVDDSIFQEWVNTMIACQSNHTLKGSLMPIIDKYSQIKEVKAEIDVLIETPIFEFFTMLAISVSTMPVLYLAQREYFEILLYRTEGKFLLSVLFTVALLGIDKAIKLSEPPQIKR